MVQILPPKTNLGTQLGQALGQGLAGGFQRGSELGLQQHYQNLQKQQQSQQRTESAGHLANQLFGPGESPQKDSLVSMLSNLEPADQIKGLQKLAEAQILNQYLSSQQANAQGNPQQESSPNAPDLSEIPAIGGLAPLARQELEKKKFEYKKQSEEKKLAFDETKIYRDSLSQQSRSAQELAPVLDQMESLIKTGNLTNPVISKLADKFGLIGLLNPSSQQFQALSVGFLQNAKSIFGSRVTNYDLQTYLDKIPRLAQTDAGKKALIDNFRTLGDASKIKNTIKNKIIKENNGVPPLDLEDRVNEVSDKELNNLWQKFNKSFYKKSPSGKILMKHPSGAIGEVDENNVQTALSKGYILE